MRSPWGKDATWRDQEEGVIAFSTGRGEGDAVKTEKGARNQQKGPKRKKKKKKKKKNGGMPQRPQKSPKSALNEHVGFDYGRKWA